MMPILSTPIPHTPGIPSHRNKARRRNKRKNNRYFISIEIVKVSLFADDMILYFKDLKLLDHK
jgi:hypothetical protein